MKKRKMQGFAGLLAFLLLLSALCGCDLSGKTENNGAMLTGSSISSERDGVFTAEVLSDGDTFVRVEYYGTKQEKLCTRWVGVERSQIPFAEGTVLCVQVIEGAENLQEYRSQLDQIDDRIWEEYEPSSVELFRIWLEREDGTEIRLYDSAVHWLIQEGSIPYVDVLIVDDADDEPINCSHTTVRFPDGSEGTALKITAKHSCDAIALFTD